MQPFAYHRAASVDEAQGLGRQPGARYLGGGTNLVDLMRLQLESPQVLIDVQHCEPGDIQTTPDGRLRVGAGVRNADLARHPQVLAHYPVLSQAILSGASAQVRNRATTAGNLLQRTRCLYFRDPAMACNRRLPGSGCPAREGYNRNLAILGTSEHCIASHPSDMAVAMLALEAHVHVHSHDSERVLPLSGLHCLPGDTPERETVLQVGELITAITLPAPVLGASMLYLKLRDRASFEFALASAAVVVVLGQGRVQYVRLALGGVGTLPWRAHQAEAALMGQVPDAALFDAAARAELAAAHLLEGTRYKFELARRCIVHALTQACRNAQAAEESRS